MDELRLQSPGPHELFRGSKKLSLVRFMARPGLCAGLRGACYSGAEPPSFDLAAALQLCTVAPALEWLHMQCSFDSRALSPALGRLQQLTRLSLGVVGGTVDAGRVLTLLPRLCSLELRPHDRLIDQGGAIDVVLAPRQPRTALRKLYVTCHTARIDWGSLPQLTSLELNCPGSCTPRLDLSACASTLRWLRIDALPLPSLPLSFPVLPALAELTCAPPAVPLFGTLPSLKVMHLVGCSLPFSVPGLIPSCQPSLSTLLVTLRDAPAFSFDQVASVAGIHHNVRPGCGVFIIDRV